MRKSSIPGEDEAREDEHHRRVDHRALDAALDLRLLLDLERDAVEDRVEDAGRLARLDHRDVEAVEDLRVARHRLREQQAALDVAAQLLQHGAEVLVVGLLLEDDERADDVQAGLDHRRELAGEDLEGLRLDRLEDGAGAFLAARRQLLELVRQQPADPQLLPGSPRIGRADLARMLESLGVDGGIGEGGHTEALSAEGRHPLRDQPEMPTRRSVNLRVREEGGFGLIELVIAMFMLNIGILALVAAFNSGAISLRRASHISTAAALADSQMELYRALTYAQIGLDTTKVGNVDNTYKCDVALIPSSGTNACPNTVTTCSVLSTCADWTVAVKGSVCALNECDPSRSVTSSNSPDHYAYRVDSYIRYKTPTNGRQLKEITVVVRDGNTWPSRSRVRRRRSIRRPAASPLAA